MALQCLLFLSKHFIYLLLSQPLHFILYWEMRGRKSGRVLNQLAHVESKDSTCTYSMWKAVPSRQSKATSCVQLCSESAGDWHAALGVHWTTPVTNWQGEPDLNGWSTPEPLRHLSGDNLFLVIWSGSCLRVFGFFFDSLYQVQQSLIQSLEELFTAYSWGWMTDYIH